MKNTKKRALYIVAALLAALFVLSCLVGFAACGGGEEPEPEPEPTPSAATVSSVSISGSKSEMAVGDEATLTASVTMDDGSNYSGSYSWSTSDSNVVSISATNTASVTATAKATGTATITLSVDNNKSATCSVSVTAATVEPEPGSEVAVKSVTVSPEELPLKMDGTATGTVTATVTMTDDKTSDSQTVTWKSSDTSVATVSETGYTATVTAVSAGTAEITASVGTVTSTNKCTVTVEAAAVVPEPTPEEPETGITTADELTEALEQGGEIALAGDIEDVSSSLKTTKDTTLDLAGNTLSSSTAEVITVEAGTLTVKDSGNDGSISYTNQGSESSSGAAWNTSTNYGEAVKVEEGGSLVLESGTIESSSVGIRVEAVSGDSTAKSSITIEDGTISSEYYTIWASGDVDITISGGTISGTSKGLFVAGDDKFGYDGVQSGTTTLTITGGTISCEKDSAICTIGNTTGDHKVINISGGKIIGPDLYDESTLVGTPMPAIYNASGNLTISGTAEIIGSTAVEHRGGNLTISGGTLTCEAKGTQSTPEYNGSGATSYGYALSIYPYNKWNETMVVSITGGTFTGDIFVSDNTLNGVDASGNTVTASISISGIEIEGEIKAVVTLESMLDWAVALDNAAVTLGADIAVSDTVSIAATVTLDLAGNTLSCASDHTITVAATGDLTVIDSSDEKTGTVDATAHQKAALVNNGTVTLKGGTFERSVEAGMDPYDSGSNSYYTVANYGTMTIEDGTTIFNAGYYSSTLRNGGSSAEATLTVNGGHIYGGLWAIKNDANGTLTVNGGIIGGARSESDTLPYAALQNWNVAYIYGGTLVGGNGSAIKDESGTYYGDGVAIYNNTGSSNSSGTLVIGKADGTGPDIYYMGQGSSTSGSGWGEAIGIDGGSVTIDGGLIWGYEANYSYGASGIYVFGGTLTVNGGEISGYYSVEIDGYGSVTINGGTFDEPICLYTQYWGGCGTLTFGEGIEDLFNKTMYGDDYEPTDDESEAGYIEYTQKTECELNGHTATAYDGTLYAVYSDDNDAWCALCEVCGEWFEIEDDAIYSFVLVAKDEASLLAAIETAGEREDGSDTNRTQIFVPGEIKISDTSYVKIDCDNVEIFGLGANYSKIIDSAYEGDHSGSAQTGVEITGKNVTIRDLTIDGTALNVSHNYSYDHAVELRAGAENVTLSNCVIIGGGPNDDDAAICIMQATGAVKIENCTLSGAYCGLVIEHGGDDIEITISGGSIDGDNRGILIDGGHGVTLIVENTTINGRNSFGSGPTSMTFTNCTFGFHISDSGNIAYGGVSTYSDVTFENCTFSSHETGTNLENFLLKTSNNYAIQANEREDGQTVSITIIDCKFKNTHTDLTIDTLDVTDGNLLYIIAYLSYGFNVVFGESENALEYIYDSSTHTVEHNHIWVVGETDESTGKTSYTCEGCGATKTEITGNHVVSATPSSGYVVTTVEGSVTAPTFAITMSEEGGSYDSIDAYLSQSGISDSVTWSSDNTSVATVDESGAITIVGTGIATITVKFEITELEASYTIYVGEKIESTDPLFGEWSGKDTVTIEEFNLSLTVDVVATVDENGFTLQVSGTIMVIFPVNETVWDSVAWYKIGNDYYVIAETGDGGWEVIDIVYDDSTGETLTTSFEFPVTYLGITVTVEVEGATLEKVDNTSAGGDGN